METAAAMVGPGALPSEPGPRLRGTMCGIAGFWGPPDPGLLATMTARIRHRGPDGEGFFTHELGSLGHRRLAIIDPEGGHQPVASPDGRVQLSYNGEVYNFRELRAE